MEGEEEVEGEEKEDDEDEDEEDEGEGEREGDGEGDGEEREEGEKRKGWMREMKEEKEEWETEKEAGIGEWGSGRRLEEEGALVVVVVVGEGKWVDGASGGGDGCSGVVLGSEEWATIEGDDVEMGHTQGGVDEGEACLSTTDGIARCMFHLVWVSASDDAVCDVFSMNEIYGEECDEYLS
ncbi:uncharacterized protein MONOS_11942 [Monocercomonoides exilis]|uniref:uncharacterized protein n=1 Tax=Monocercomonoides exilis TaxID=2049356 RepID=UPI00355A01F3|nr:hypothetical protein MONOS_11942 [Monocercomonoides exilis]|eukprot:MONOS_11942.1-p1 / transcript=MONOS_11942.1 / gene=MONOS_11942 / organism=Monocercomonoides_exilis_PA203 / gene_product=unspecified product / transcript_product=unspecified product / location=Mono_scaffold00628:24788-25419(-) / protein_length=181 / sequence_SO=supercontig / SO=protein_coding / is_pseudo=false